MSTILTARYQRHRSLLTATGNESKEMDNEACFDSSSSYPMSNTFIESKVT